MQPAEILCAISQFNAEIAERQSELECLKQLYTEKANADIQNALKAVTHGLWLRACESWATDLKIRRQSFTRKL